MDSFLQKIGPIILRVRRAFAVQGFAAGEAIRQVSMRTFRKELWFTIPTRRAFVNITAQVEDCLRESGVREGMVLVNAMHITASVFLSTVPGI